MLQRTAFVLILAACGDSSNMPPDAVSQDATIDAGIDYTWSAAHVGPASGFVSAVAFAPGSGTLWISGDDTSGLYRSTDGGTTLAPAAGAPLDWSTYGFAFSSSGGRVVAASHFGRGVAVSEDAGSTWSVLTMGLPQGADDARRIHDAEVLGDGTIVLATGSGLYRSRATQFEPLISAPGGYTQIARTASGYLAGTDTGRIWSSVDGLEWTELTTEDGATITDIAVGALGTYVANTDGLVVRLTPAGGLDVIANPATDARFATALWTKLAVAPHASTDRIYLGVVGAANRRAAAKLFVSSNGGATFVARSTNLGGSSAFAIAVDPADSAHAVLGTVGEGAFVTRDAGLTWSATTGDLRATAVLGFAQDPSDPDHLLLASVESLPGTPSLWERAGGAWTLRPGLVDDARSLAYDGATVIAGGFAGAAPLRASAAGAAGTFAIEAGGEGDVMRLIRTSHGLHALSGTLARRAGGAWTTLWTAPVNDLAEATDALVICGVGMFSSASGDFTDAVELRAPPHPWFGCDIDGGGAVVATGNGELWRAPSIAAATSTTAWTRVPTPLDGVQLLSIRTARSTWVIGGGDVDVAASVTSRSGLYVSEDAGSTWQRLDTTPSGTVWQLHRGHDRDELFAAMWGGGLWRLTRPARPL